MLPPSWLHTWPLARWLQSYQRHDALGDLLAGLVVAVMLIPQGMAYAFLAGLPPQMGLYAALFPLILYALLGSSRSMAVGPVAIASLMTGEALRHSGTDPSQWPLVAAQLALLVGVCLLGLRLLNAASIVNFISHSVIKGFTSAAALVIALNQLKYLLDIDLPRGDFFTLITALPNALPQSAGDAVLLSLLCLGLLWGMQNQLAPQLIRLGWPKLAAQTLARSGPLVLILASLVLLPFLWPQAQLAKVGAIPAGLPDWQFIVLDLGQIQALFPSALLIALVGYLESISVATALASQKRERIAPRQELLALGIANLGAAFTQAYPVAGGFGRSMVNHNSGARTTLASLLAAGVLALVVAFFTPWFADLPKVVLGAIVVMAVLPLIDISAIWQTWAFNRADALTLLASFLGVLFLGVELGILLGISLSIALLLKRSAQPHIAELGRVPNSEHFRNVQRHQVQTLTQAVFLRVDENLYFANTHYIEDKILDAVSTRPQLTDVVLVCSAVNFIDASALESLETLIERLAQAKVRLHLAEVKGPVSDQLAHSHLLTLLQQHQGQIFLSCYSAFCALQK
ncbi:sulfate permease, SulP family [Allopseudospirillum japonicum]|uniref:Sulfate permease, SulP family n=1 Tax=Allopseudospirillum japonicum TaxID=64971 RepID=A0A1H6T297_9GAMM|nr:sulfate permease [Allopseudospirillum japonicum]SEI74188.1 sulfate permease, SulP family [Allopseudospirillum japonicum]